MDDPFTIKLSINVIDMAKGIDAALEKPTIQLKFKP
jgi:hypothetical protein